VPDGPGGPENANLTGLPASYIVQQMLDFKSGARKSSVPNLAPQALKASMSKAIAQAEIEEVAAYFSAIKPRSIVRVIESATVPKTYVTGWHLAAVVTGETEPIGQRMSRQSDLYARQAHVASVSALRRVDSALLPALAADRPQASLAGTLSASHLGGG
jgi:hypothetical protein